jgi:hypothetical protein
VATTIPATEVPHREVSIERIFGRAFGTVRANPAATLGIAFLFGALPVLVLNLLLLGMQPQLAVRIGPWGTAAAGLLILAFTMAVAAITHGALVEATVAYSDGRRSSFGEAATAGLVVFLPLAAASILSTVAITLAMLLLFVPGVILYCLWIATTPAVVAERLGPIEALRRSRYLTRGARWKVFGIVLILVVAYWLITAVFSVLSLSMFRGTMGFSPAGRLGQFPIEYWVLSAVVQTVTTCLWGVVVTALYVELRDWKDGPRSDALAEVFR